MMSSVIINMMTSLGTAVINDNEDDLTKHNVPDECIEHYEPIDVIGII